MNELNENNIVEAEKNLCESEKGASLVEYALLVALIAVVCIAAVSLLGTNASAKFSSVASNINAAG